MTDRLPISLSQVLNACTAAALTICGLLLLSAFYVEGQLVRAFCLGAFFFALIVSILLLVIARITRALEKSRQRFQQAIEVSNDLSAKLSFQETHDALTGLVNRREFERRVDETLRQNSTQPLEHALCHINIDRFKVINETCGPSAGDELLVELASLLRKRVRHRDTLARIGGDEFGIIMRDCSLEHAEHVAETLLELLGELRFNWRGKRYAIGASVGLVPLTDPTNSVSHLLSAADAACHAAKDKGGHRVFMFSDNDSELAKRHGHMRWVSRINRALDENRFRLSFQPIAPIRPAENPLIHYELLLRLQDELGNMVAPGAFLPAAELYSLSTKLDRWVLTTAFQWLDGHPRHVEQLSVCAINLSGHSLGDDQFLNFVIDLFARSRVPASKICFEITETAVIENLDHASRFIGTLKALGSQFALDDFGSGLSSFAYLKMLPVDYLKIDGMFIKDIHQDPIHLAMVQSINEVGHLMGMETVAEFVENDEILATLREVGVDYAQGYGICPPRPLDIFEQVERENVDAHKALITGTA
ncbi:MAG: EAL domain-containing protein [Gammaproteobacteria bacterium]|nr:EAL domain-containing protein [Gammaproteobacteria bacterium]NIM74140.1 EAL domain-containing protein [Gammaproteobacteria bacterium]NIN39023.1 EAL domain-containing protein [Gammaproteobacteria bacterium]NIO25916.1 EAL domain-containing protein [Gammaproteobacteria bacterium]NIO66547.1 EAL domain-containing protein [Gammaproteobacteria bacterium]